MPERPPRPCSHPQCGNLVHGPKGSRCDEHPAAHRWRDRGTFEQRYGMGRAAWDALCARVLARDRHRCYLCGRWASGVDHKIPVSLGGARRDPANLGAICDERDRPDNCHGPKTRAEAAAAKAAAMARRAQSGLNHG